jgi:hypothetical protein
MFSSYRRLDCYSLLQQSMPDVEVHIVRAALSDRWSRRELQQLEKLSRQSEKPKVSNAVLLRSHPVVHVLVFLISKLAFSCLHQPQPK